MGAGLAMQEICRIDECSLCGGRTVLKDVGP